MSIFTKVVWLIKWWTLTEEDLVLPSLAILIDENKQLTTTQLIQLLREKLIPGRNDTIQLPNRKDDKFSQKVRNLISHKTLESKWYIKKVGRNLIEITDLWKEFVTNNK